MEFYISVRYDSMLKAKRRECLGEGRGDPVATGSPATDSSLAVVQLDT